MINELEIEKGLNTKCFGKVLKAYQEVASTNDVAKNEAERLPEGALIISEVQTGGRGRQERTWFSPRGGLWFSLVLKPEKLNNLIEINYLSAISVINVLRKNYGICCFYRWPNDLMLEGKKLGGFLAESKISGKNLAYVVLGVGLNVNIEEFPEELKDVASSIYLLQNRKLEREKLVCEILEEFEKNYFIWKGTDISCFLGEVNTYCQTLGGKVRVTLGNETLEGTAISIEKDGALRIKLDDGNCREIYSCDRLEEAA